MYKRFNRLSFYISKQVAWVRIRAKDGSPTGFFFQIGREKQIRF